MLQVRLFKGVENEIRDLEREINAWLQDSGAKVVNMFGNIAPQSSVPDAKLGKKFEASDLFICVVYEQA